MPWKDTRLDINSEFTLSNQPEVVSDILRSHIVVRGTLKDSATTFIRKEINDPALAQLELLAQEFFRLIIPHQPETYLAVDKDSPTHRGTGVHYILSQEVSGYKPLPTGQAKKFSENGGFTGLGLICLIALFLQEIDLKNGNLGLNDKGQVIKLDGDRCFSALKRQAVYKISPRALNNLPFPQDFYTNNWLDIVSKGVAKTVSAIIDADISQSPKFRAEVNQAILRICLLPDIFIEQFVDAYISAGGERFVTLLKERREELRASALKNPSFVNYQSTPEATTEVSNCILHMKNFKANRTELITTSPDLDTLVKAQMQGLQSSVLQAKGLITEINQLLTQFQEIAAPGKNKELDNFLIFFKQKLVNSGHDSVPLLALKKELVQALPLAKKAEVVEQSRILMTQNNELLNKIKTLGIFNRNADFRAFIEDKEMLIKSSWLDLDKLQRLHGFFTGMVLTDEVYSLVFELKHYIVSYDDVDLIDYIKNIENEIPLCNNDVVKLGVIKQKLTTKMLTLPALLKKDCDALIQEMKKHATVDPKLTVDITSDDPKKLLAVKKELVKQFFQILEMDIQRYISVIRLNVAKNEDKDLHQYLQETEVMLSKGEATQESLKKVVAELKDKYLLIEQANDLKNVNRVLIAKINGCIDSNQNHDYTDRLMAKLPHAITACGHNPQLLLLVKTELEGVLKGMEQSLALIMDCKQLLEDIELYTGNQNDTNLFTEKLRSCGQEPDKLLAMKVELNNKYRIAFVKEESALILRILESYKMGGGDLILGHYIQKARAEIQSNSQNLAFLNEKFSELSRKLASVNSKFIIDIKTHIQDLRSRGKAGEARADGLENTLSQTPFENREPLIKAELLKLQDNQTNSIGTNIKEQLMQMKGSNPDPAPSISNKLT